MHASNFTIWCEYKLGSATIVSEPSLQSSESIALSSTSYTPYAPSSSSDQRLGISHGSCCCCPTNRYKSFESFHSPSTPFNAPCNSILNFSQLRLFITGFLISHQNFSRYDVHEEKKINRKFKRTLHWEKSHSNWYSTTVCLLINIISIGNFLKLNFQESINGVAQEKMEFQFVFQANI